MLPLPTRVAEPLAVARKVLGAAPFARRALFDEAVSARIAEAFHSLSPEAG